MNSDDTITPKLSGPEMARAYRNYLLTCRRNGVEPVPRERALGLIAEWSEMIAASRAVPPTTH